VREPRKIAEPPWEALSNVQIVPGGMSYEVQLTEKLKGCPTTWVNR